MAKWRLRLFGFLAAPAVLWLVALALAFNIESTMTINGDTDRSKP